MAWDVEYQAHLYVEYLLTGRVSGRDLKEAASKGITMAKKHDTVLHLINIKKAEAAKADMPLIDIFELPSKVYFNEGLNRRSRFAVVLPKPPKVCGMAQFYETVSVNRGWCVQCFETRDEAVEWLRKSKTPNQEPLGSSPATQHTTLNLKPKGH
jgi:hypothetical protein